MSTPNEGPGTWERGNAFQALEWLSSLDEQAQRNVQQISGYSQAQMQRLDQLVNSQPLRARVTEAVTNAVGRVHTVYQQTTQRLSDAAQSLATQANQYRQVAVDRATQAGQQVAATYRDTRDAAVDRATQFGQQVAGAYRDTRDAAVDRANQFGQQVAGAYQTGRDAVVDRATRAGQQVAGAYQTGRDAVVDAAQRGQVRMDQAWQRGTQRMSEAGQAVAQTARNARDAVAAGGQRVADAGHRISRWARGEWTRAQVSAQAAAATFSSFRNDPTIPQNVYNPRETLQLSQHISRVAAAQTPEARLEALQAWTKETQAQVDNQTASHALSGVAPASRAAAPQTQVNTGQEQGEHGAQSQTGANVTTKQPGKDIQR